MHVNNDTQHVYLPFNGFTTSQRAVSGCRHLQRIVNDTAIAHSQCYLDIFNEQWNNDERRRDEEVWRCDQAMCWSILIPSIKMHLNTFISLRSIISSMNSWKTSARMYCPMGVPDSGTSVIWNKLYNFNVMQPLAIINKLEKYNGCILAVLSDWAKTFTALAVISIENRNKSVLVLHVCPKKLNDNWRTFRANIKIIL